MAASRALKVLGVVGALVVLFAIWLHRADQEDTTSAARTAISASVPANRADDVRVDAWIDDSRIHEGSAITFWIAVQNTTAAPIRGVSVLAFRKPNFSVDAAERQTCWAGADDAGQVPVCVVAGARPSRLPVALAPGGVATVEGHLRAQEQPGQYSIAAVIGWTDAAGAQRRIPISVGPVTVEHEGKKNLATITRASQNFLKDLGLPLVFLWLAYWVKQLEDSRQGKKKTEEQEREQSRKEEDDRRAEERKLAEEETARVRQTWTQMLPKVHENAEKYYMPLMGYARLAADMHAARNGAAAFFYYLRFLARMRDMADAIGGFYLKTRLGENLVSDIWDAVRKRADARLGQPVRQQLQVDIRSVETIGAFLELLGAETTIATAYGTWREGGTFEIDAALLSLFHHVLTYETNQSYEFWYEEREVYPAAEIRDVLAELDHLQPSPELKYERLKDSLSKYESAAKARSVQTSLQGA